MKARKQLRHGDVVGEADELQWGRADEGAETLSALRAQVQAILLQWGRADEGAETVG